MIEEYDLLSANNETTVVSHYEREDSTREAGYQSEADMERSLIERLVRQGYERITINGEAELVGNLRRQIEKLNGISFTDGEWDRFFRTEIANEGKGIKEKAFTIQTDSVKTMTREDGTTRNIRLIDKDNIHANRTQVMNQYSVEAGGRKNRYDVTILVNGLPMVHIELKRRGKMLREAFDQINRYGRETFWSGSGLFEYVQIFVISNGTETKYYSNTTRDCHVREQASRIGGKKSRTCNSYEFTSYWADAGNRVIGDIEDFAATFFSRHTLLSVLTRYCVLTEQKVLMVMRPYQIAATERLLMQIEAGHNMQKYGTRDGGGYVWHTTGSGKTLTSFKAAQLATKMAYIDKVLFVVDRKDLDYQTMKEYDRFQKGAANGNTSTKELERQIGDGKSKIIITTIQKLTNYVKKNPQSEIYKKEVVMIFDECHRSQFGDMHQQIVKKFKKYYLFGFTGTPIFAENVSASSGIYKTTEDVFGRRIHTYTIVDAIRDHNVLPFRVDYVRTMKEKEEIENAQVWDIEREKALEDPQRIRKITEYIVDKFGTKTMRGNRYKLSKVTNIGAMAADRRKRVDADIVRSSVDGFNSILAVQNIHCARMYYEEMKRVMSELPSDKRLKVATIYSFAPNEADPDEMEVDENSDSTEGLDESSRDFLEGAIADYNEMFGTSYDTSGDKFPNYYKDVSLRMKNREIDILIVVNMFLTGFDATTLNTLWVDKNLRYHGLLQSYSRTNRILNSIKTFGNIVCFRNLEEQTNKCIALFGDADARSITILRSFEDYFFGYRDEKGKVVKGYAECVEELKAMLKPGERPMGEKAEKAFIGLFGTILKMRNLLSCFDQFEEADTLTERDVQDYSSIYLDLASQYRQEKHEKESITDDVVFEVELLKHVEVTIDYILFLVSQYHEGHNQDMEIRVRILKAVESSPDLRDKRELIEKFIDSLTPDSDVEEKWKAYVEKAKREELENIIEEERLRREQTEEFMEGVFMRGFVPDGGLELDGIMPPINPFDRKANRQGKIERVLDRLKAYFSKFYGIAGGD